MTTNFDELMTISCDDCGMVTEVRDIHSHNGGLVECVNCGNRLFASCPRCDWARIDDEGFSILHGYHKHLSDKHPEFIEKKKKMVRSWREEGMTYSELSERFNWSVNTIKKWVGEDES